MVWVRVTDTFAFDPRLLDVVEHELADSRTVNEVAGFALRMATQSAAHKTDYVVGYSTSLSLASGSRDDLERLWVLCEFAGLGERVVNEEGRRAFRMTADAEFIHLKLAEEVAFEQQRKSDNANPHITMPVRLRDGDACRYCGHVVFWADRKGGKGGTYDHRPPGLPATAETAVVACRSCNSARGAISRGLPPEAGLLAADERHPLLNVPREPYYSASTRQLLILHAPTLAQFGMTPPSPAPEGWKDVKVGTPAPGAAAAPQLGEARRATAASAPTVATPATGWQRPARAAEARGTAGGGRSADLGRSQQVRSLPDPDSPGRDGTGRGSGRGGSGLEGAGAAPPSRRRRGRRGGRGRSTGGDQR